MPSMSVSHGGILYYVVKVPRDEYERQQQERNGTFRSDSRADSRNTNLDNKATTPTSTSGEIGWENPFRPDGDLSKEADQIVELIKEGKPINEENLRSKSPSVLNSTTLSFINSKGGKKGTNGTTNGLEVQRGIVAQSNQAGQIEHVTLKKQKKGCCVVQ